MILLYPLFKQTKLKESKSSQKEIFILLTFSITKISLQMKSQLNILKIKFQNLMTRTEFHRSIVNKLVKFKIKPNRQKGNQSFNIILVIKEDLINHKIKLNVFIKNRKKGYKVANQKVQFLKLKKHKKKISYKFKIQKMRFNKTYKI